MNYLNFALLILLGHTFTTTAFGQSSIDSKLTRYIEIFTIKSPKTIPGKGSAKYEFGKMLFEDRDLSMVRKISCKSCHDPQFGTSDALPVSIGVGGEHKGLKSRQMQAQLTSRSSPHLFNKGHDSFRTMFWDGRVFYNQYEQMYETPEDGLNGHRPDFVDIVSKIENVMSMQALFPIASIAEMRSQKFASLSNREVWRRISNRIKNKKVYKKYITPDFNIADIANALAFFQKIEFQVNDTPFDEYIAGDKEALSINEKQGAIVFMEKGRCSRCHHGEILSNQAFQGVSVPQIGPGHTKDKNDEGRFLITGKEFHKYGFLTQPLRNIALTAPFMHDGALRTLMDVVNHYDNPSRSLDNFDVNALQKAYKGIFDEFIFVDKNPYRNFYRKEALAPPIKRPLGLNITEKKNLVCFLKKSLTQAKFHSRIDLSECR